MAELSQAFHFVSLSREGGLHLRKDITPRCQVSSLGLSYEDRERPSRIQTPLFGDSLTPCLHDARVSPPQSGIFAGKFGTDHVHGKPISFSDSCESIKALFGDEKWYSIR